MALTKISTGGVKDDAASQAKIADEAIDEARLQVSNAGTNGQFLSKQSGNTGGLTWSDVPAQYTHPNHSGEVTSTGDGATVIADNIVDEANLKVSNTPTNGHFLSAQSGNTGGLTWAEVSAAPTIQATADGALAAHDPIVVNSDGTVSKAAIIAALTGSKAEIKASEAADADVVYDKTNNKVVAVWEEGNNFVGAIAGTVNASNNTITWGNVLTVYQNYNVHQIAAAATQNSNGDVIVVWHRAHNSQTRGMHVRTSSSNNNLTLYNSGSSEGTLLIDTGINTSNQEAQYSALDIAWDTTAQKGCVVQNDASERIVGCGCMIDTNGNLTAGSTEVFQHSNFSTGFKGGAQVVFDSTQRKMLVVTCRFANDDIHALTLDLENGGNDDDLKNIQQFKVILSSIGDSFILDMDYSVDHKRVLMHEVQNSRHKVHLIDVGTALGTSMVKSSLEVNGEWGSGFGCTTYNAYHKQWFVQFKTSNDMKYCMVNNINDTLSKSTTTAIFSSSNNGKSFQAAFDEDTERIVFVFTDIADGDDHTGVVIRSEDSSLKEGNFIGFANAAYSDSATATVNVVGNTTTQSSLTAGKKYYIQTDGTLSTTADTPSVEAGIALSSTKLLVK